MAYEFKLPDLGEGLTEGAACGADIQDAPAWPVRPSEGAARAAGRSGSVRRRARRD